MVTPEMPRLGELDALVTALAGRDMVVVAPHGTVNTGVVTGDQRQTVSTSPDGDTTPGALRQGPVRSAYLEAARRRFVPPPCFENALAALDSGIAVLIGEPGTGRETHALNLLAHGSDEPMLVQVDGAVDLSLWGPRAQGVHGYLVTEPPDPLQLRAWDLSRLEAPLAEAGARLLIVLAEAPGLAGTLEDRLGVPVVRHRPPDPRKVFTSHLSDGCADKERLAQWLRALEPGLLDELLPEGLSPRHAAQAAESTLRLGVAGGASGAEVVRHLAQAEGTEVVARVRADPTLLAHLLSLSVYGGLPPSVVRDQAGQLLRLVRPGGEQEPAARSPHDHSFGDTRHRTWSETLRLLGARQVRRAGENIADTVSFFRPAMSETVWEVLCRDHADLVPRLHTWLARPGDEADQIERAGRAVAAMASATEGRSMEYLRDLALAPSLPAPQVAGWCLGAALRDPAAARTAADLLEEWSITAEKPLREAVAHACQAAPLTEEHTLRLLRRLMETLDDDSDGLSLAALIVTALVQRFETSGSEARAAVLCHLRDWVETGGIPGLLVAFAVPFMTRTDLAWWSDHVLSDSDSVSVAVHLAGHALNEPATFADMRDTLLDWCSEAVGAEHLTRALNTLLDGLVAAREPGFLRWLLAVDRVPDAVPGKEPAARSLAAWRGDSPASNPI
ncbi:hypothetical protein MUU72_16295 [Streptomyces sp. RS10V-4]|uniref:hypothetical protein n=1 Tax=Streptomyces rhizoryzae TaxID=2932493 RepID=UPI002002A26C|nr:hypothetical protein [Streptomyces rhizoryzae]MCK7624641.1 hypothetical protein [Streptomyces rhizoryzae]